MAEMSELKAIRSGEIYNIIEYEDCYRTNDLYYPKSEADNAIAELKDKLENVSSLLKETREWLVESQKLHKRCADNAGKIIRHYKYKRCLAMARWCRSRACFYDTMREDGPYWSVKSDRAYKWYNWWFKTAFQFKEAK